MQMQSQGKSQRRHVQQMKTVQTIKAVIHLEENVIVRIHFLIVMKMEVMAVKHLIQLVEEHENSVEEVVV